MMTVTGDNVPKKSLKIKILMKKIEAEAGTRLVGSGPKVSLLEGHGYGNSFRGNEDDNRFDDKEFTAGNAKIKPARAGSKKRAASCRVESQKEKKPRLESQKDKKPRLDQMVKRQCSCILKNLMDHPDGWIFSKPVNPVALNIPDYFSIISHPMDLGTIQSKLKKNMYFSIEDFAADIRLTFSNAMLYNPPLNPVHVGAKELNDIFNERWKTEVSKVNCKNSSLEQEKHPASRKSDIRPQRKNFHASAVSNDDLLSKKPMAVDERQMLKKELAGVLNGKMPLHLHARLQKLGLVFPNQEKVEMLIDTCDENVLWELKRVSRSCLRAKSAFGKGTKASQKCGSMSLLNHKGLNIDDQNARGLSNVNYPSNLVACKCSSCGTCSNGKSVSSQEFSSDLSSGKSVCKSEVANKARNIEVTRSGQFYQDPDGASNALDVDNSCSTSKLTAVTVSTYADGDTPPLDLQLSPKKALRAAMLKSRFVDTILKAQHRTLLDHYDTADPVKLQQEKERLERKQRQEKARIEAQIKAAETVCKIQREKEREASRIALQKMELTVDIVDNFKVLKDLEALSGCPFTCAGNPLEQLGLFRKDVYLGQDEQDEWGIL